MAKNGYNNLKNLDINHCREILTDLNYRMNMSPPLESYSTMYTNMGLYNIRKQLGKDLASVNRILNNAKEEGQIRGARGAFFQEMQRNKDLYEVIEKAESGYQILVKKWLAVDKMIRNGEGLKYEDIIFDEQKEILWDASNGISGDIEEYDE